MIARIARIARITRIVRPSALALLTCISLLSPVAFATVRPRHHGSTHAIVRRTATSLHATRAAHASYIGISSERATEIQSALIQHGYLTGEPSGAWDSASMAAMQKMQGDNGWQTKLVPDSRALIKLGLGPNNTPVNPNTSATAQTPPPSQSF